MLLGFEAAAGDRRHHPQPLGDMPTESAAGFFIGLNGHTARERSCAENRSAASPLPTAMFPERWIIATRYWKQKEQ